MKARSRSKSAGAPDTWNYENWDDDWVVHAPVGSFAANPFGLHDVIGNVREWVQDNFSSSYGAKSELARVVRGGVFDDNATVARSAYRAFWDSQNSAPVLGVRPVRGLIE